jgi:cellulose synthase/poly-beta-1,6-N-acetylglucosamine synthase-like glycosyltransferase
LIAAAHLQLILSRLAEPVRWPVYTILCPLYREANVTPDLIAAINAIDYPKDALDVKILVEGDDPDTIAAALAAANAPHFEVIVIPAAAPRTKPKALNVGLARARGAFVTVYDAEDRPHPQQLRASLWAFEDGDESLACVQAPLVIDNQDASWISRQFAAEYAIQFRELLPLLAKLRLPLPLGGTSNHFRTNVLRAIGGWDPYNVTEDADLGYRLARDGHTSGVIAPPTWEEAPVTFQSWLDQRTRWIKGHMQTWLVLMRNPIRTAREMGLPSFAAMHVMLTGGLIAAFVHGPLALILIAAALLPNDLLTTADFILALFGYCVSIFAALTACALSNSLSHAWAALSMPAYWPLSSLAAYRALFALMFRPHRWAKTDHGVSARRRYLAASPPKGHV